MQEMNGNGNSDQTEEHRNSSKEMKEISLGEKIQSEKRGSVSVSSPIKLTNKNFSKQKSGHVS